MIPSNTPPNGDFVRYVERLSGAPVAAGSKEDLRVPQPNPAGMPLSTNAGLLTGEVSTKLVTGQSLVHHIKWLASAFVIIQVIGIFIPVVSFLFFPILLAYVVWAIFKAKRLNSKSLATKLYLPQYSHWEINLFVRVLS